MKKPRKVKDIVFTGTWGRGFVVHADLRRDQLEEIPGVTSVYTRTSGRYEVRTNPLYDVHEIMKYIKWLASSCCPDPEEKLLTKRGYICFRRPCPCRKV